MSRLVLGTRGSALALWQADHVASRLRKLHDGLDVEVREIKTRGDVDREVPFGQLEGKGFFVKEIETALQAGEIDLAVHSLKDMPSELPRGLALSAILERHDPRDAVITADGSDLLDLPPGTVLGTGSMRRRSQLLHARSDLRVTGVRGNVNTRLRKLSEGRFGALILALAGIERLGITDVPLRAIPVEVCLPAVGQGAVTVETRADDEETRRFVDPLNHEPTVRAVTAERAFLARLEGGCLAPATAHARIGGESVRVEGMVGDPDGKRMLRARVEGTSGQERELGDALARELLDAGAATLLREARQEADS
jgi:hydroxymethylbilane synthase